VPPIFKFLQKAGDIDTGEMYRAFNMGIGYVMVAVPEDADKIMRELKKAGEPAVRIGRIKKGEAKVILT
jgi:phosphoribosylformylglycinamidine cyclo-ligase